jgi:hypothetical protein
MPDSDHGDLVVRYREDDTVITNAKSKMSLPLSAEHLYVACAGIAIFSQLGRRECEKPFPVRSLATRFESTQAK